MKSEFIKAIISTTGNDDLPDKDLEVYRILCLAITLLVPVFWIFHKLINPWAVDSVETRIIVCLISSSILAASYKSKYVVRHIAHFMLFLYYVITIWVLYLNFLNAFSDYSLLLIISTFAITVLGLRKRAELIVYPLLVISLTVLVFCLTKEPQVNANLFVSNLISVSLVSYIVSSSRLKTQEELAVKQELMLTIFDDSADALLIADPISWRIMNCNNRARVVFESTDKQDLIGISITALLTNASMRNEYFDIKRQVDSYGVCSTQIEYITQQSQKKWGDFVVKGIKILNETILLIRISDITQIKQAEEALQKANDELEIRVEARTAELSKSNVLLKQEINERQRAEKQLIHAAFHDTLTGLPNRTLFIERLEHAVEQAKRSRDAFFAVLFVDLDRFKVVNDSLGHMVGDQLLLAIASRIKTCLRSGDTCARLGGDEFTILLEDIKDVSDALRVANRIQEELTLPFNLNGHEVFTSASIGIALSKTCQDRPEQLLRDADTAMYRAKSRGKARYEVFDIAMHASAIALLQLETDLRRAIERQEFRLHYQPIVSLENCKIVGFEALIRWQHPERGFICPAEFITVAEETGLIIPIGWWVLRQACYQMNLWQEKFPANTPLTISVNISGKQFSNTELREQIQQILQGTGLDPQTLKLELTESTIMENAESATVMLSQLRSLGVQLYMDDFGTGYSSLSYLQRFPINTLKIDRSFISRMSPGDENREIVRTIVSLAHNLCMSVTAEGIETIEQVAFLRTLGCEYGQGYFFSKPVDDVEAGALIMAEQHS